MTFWVALVVIVLDQLTKYYVRATMELGESIPVIPNVWHWTHIENHGAAFGILAHQQWFFLLVVAILFALFFWYRERIPREPKYFSIAVGLLLGGALGNAWDRFYQGGVTDFFDLRVWPIFNVADIAICVAVACFCLFFWRRGNT